MGIYDIMDTYFRNILTESGESNLELSAELKEYLLVWFKLFVINFECIKDHNKDHNNSIDFKKSQLDLIKEVCSVYPSEKQLILMAKEFHFILSKSFKFIEDICKKAKRLRITKTLFVEALEKLFPEINKQLGGLIHGIELSDDYSKKYLDLRTKSLIKYVEVKEEVKEVKEVKEESKKESKKIIVKTLDDVIALKNKMIESLDPLCSETFEQELKQLGNIISYIESYEDITNNKLKNLVKFYKKFVSLEKEKETEQILEELIVFLLMKKFNCSSEVQVDYKKNFTKISQLYV